MCTRILYPVLRLIAVAVIATTFMVSTTEATIRLVPEQHNTLQAAMDASAAFDTISIAAGTHGGDASSSIPLSLIAREPVPATVLTGSISIDAGSDFSNACHVTGLAFVRKDGLQLYCANGEFVVSRNLFDSTYTLGPAITYFPENVVGRFENNYMRHNGWGLVAYGGTALLVRNNVFRDCAGSGITTLSNNASTFSYNCFYNNARDTFGDGLDVGNLIADPLIDGVTLLPMLGSPCIDAGDPASPLDPDGSRADIGAAVDGLIVGLVDSVWVESALAQPNDTVIVRVGLSNPITTVAGMTIPLQYGGVGVSLIQVTHVDRGLKFDVTSELIDSAAQTVLLGYVGIDSVLSPGVGFIAELTFVIESAAPDQIVFIDSTMLPPFNNLTIVDTDAMGSTPAFAAGALTVVQCAVDVPGDIQGDSEISIVDLVYLVNYLMRGGPAPVPVLAAGDVDCDGNVSLADVIYLVNFIYRAGTPPCDPCL